MGMKIEDEMYESWKVWAQREIQAQKALAGSAYTGVEEEAALDVQVAEGSALDQVAGSVKVKGGQTVVHP